MVEKPAIEVMAQGAPNVGGKSPTYNILFPHKIIKQQWKKIYSSRYMLQLHDCQNTPQLPLKIVLYHHWKTTVTLNCFISLHLSDLFKHRYNLIKVGK